MRNGIIITTGDPGTAAELAQNRGEAIRDYLLSQKLPADRIFVAAPKSGTQPNPSPRAELSLSTR